MDQPFLDLELMAVADLPDPCRHVQAGPKHPALVPSDLNGFLYAEPGSDFSAIAQLQAEVAAKSGTGKMFQGPPRLRHPHGGDGPGTHPLPTPRATSNAASQNGELLLHGELLAMLNSASSTSGPVGLPPPAPPAPAAASSGGLVMAAVAPMADPVRSSGTTVGSASDGSASTRPTNSDGPMSSLLPDGLGGSDSLLLSAGGMDGSPAVPTTTTATNAPGGASAASTSTAGAPSRPSGRPRQKKDYDHMIDPSLPPDQIRRLRRMLSNRESARRSRRRRQTQVSGLETELEEVRRQVARLSAELERSNSIAQHALMERSKAVTELEMLRSQFARSTIEATSFHLHVPGAATALAAGGLGAAALSASGNGTSTQPSTPAGASHAGDTPSAFGSMGLFEGGRGASIPRHSAPALISAGSEPISSLPTWLSKHEGLGTALWSNQ